MTESRHRRRRGRAAPRGSRSAAAMAVARPRRRKTNKFIFLASLVTAVLVIAGFAVGSVNFGNRSAQTGNSQEYVEGVGVRQDLMPVGPRGLNAHVPESESVTYSAFPPTSGDHWATPTACGFYEDGLNDERIMHNLEHGNIVVSYNLATKEEVDQLRDVMDGIGLSQVWGVTRFYEKIPVGTVAVAAWGVLDTMDGIDGDRIETFFKTYAGNLGPEQIICPGAQGPMNR